MGWTIAGIILLIVVAFFAVLVIRAVMFQPRKELVPAGDEVKLNEEKIVRDMQELIRCKTVSYNDETLIDQAEFQRFRELLPKLYPQIHARCERKFLGKTGGRSCGTDVPL